MAGYQASANRPMSSRVRLFKVFFLTLLAVAVGGAAYLQIYGSKKLEQLARDQYQRQLIVAPRRGDILDARGLKLAESVAADSVFVDAKTAAERPRNRREPAPVTDEQLVQLARVLSLDAAGLREKFSDPGRRFDWLKHRVTAEEAAAVRALNVKGVGFVSEFKRYYPQKNLAAHLLGRVGDEEVGQEGIELNWDKSLRGDSAPRRELRDAYGRKLLDEPAVSSELVVGSSLQLTLHGGLQHAAEQALAAGVEKARAKGGIAVVMEPSTGAILAMANYPPFNPNNRAREGGERRNVAVQSQFEPGSTMKCFLNGAALSEKQIWPEKVIDVSGGVMQIGKRRIRDSHKPKKNAETALEVLETSSNVGSARIGLMLGKQGLMGWYEKFGFGQAPGSGLPGEGKGRLHNPSRMGDIDVATSSFGQSIAATPLQMTAALAAIANDGVLMRPYVVSKVVRSDGETVAEHRPEVVRRVLEPAVAKTLTRMMRGVVDEGTGSKAAIAGYAVAGKTGTAQKVDPKKRGYGDKRFSSFMGFLPAEVPRLAIYVGVDEPTGEVYGGTVAAPIFREIALAGLHEFSIPPEVAADPIAATLDKQQATAAKAAAKGGAKKVEVEEAFVEGFVDDGGATVAEESAEGSQLVPDLTGMSARAALRLLGERLLEGELEGIGRATGQEPGAGTRVAPGTLVHVVLGDG